MTDIVENSSSADRNWERRVAKQLPHNDEIWNLDPKRSVGEKRQTVSTVRKKISHSLTKI